MHNRKKMMGRNVNPGLTEPYLMIEICSATAVFCPLGYRRLFLLSFQRKYMGFSFALASRKKSAD